MAVVVLNGPINTGKTTIGRALAGILPGARFIDGDDHGAPDDVPFEAMLEIALARVEREIASFAEPVLVVAYPLRQEDHDRLRVAAEARGQRLLTVTLAPPMAVALANRGERRLEPDEVARSREMYDEGYADRPFSDLTITTLDAPLDMARSIAGHFGLG